MQPCATGLDADVCRDLVMLVPQWPVVITAGGEAARWWTMPDVWVAIFTATLTAATIVLGFATWRLWRATQEAVADTARGLRIAEQSAAAALRQADVAERALIGLERPYVLLNHIEGGRNRLSRSPDYGSELKLSFELKNYGRTPAMVQSVSFEIFYGETVPEQFDYDRPNMLLGNAVLSSTDQPMILTAYQADVSFSPDGVTVAEAKFLILYGSITYKDMLGYTYIRRAAYRYLRNDKVLTLPDARFNSEKRLDPLKEDHAPLTPIMR